MTVHYVVRAVVGQYACILAVSEAFCFMQINEQEHKEDLPVKRQRKAGAKQGRAPGNLVEEHASSGQV